MKALVTNLCSKIAVMSVLLLLITSCGKSFEYPKQLYPYEMQLKKVIAAHNQGMQKAKTEQQVSEQEIKTLENLDSIIKHYKGLSDNPILLSVMDIHKTVFKAFFKRSNQKKMLIKKFVEGQSTLHINIKKRAFYESYVADLAELKSLTEGQKSWLADVRNMAAAKLKSQFAEKEVRTIAFRPINNLFKLMTASSRDGAKRIIDFVDNQTEIAEFLFKNRAHYSAEYNEVLFTKPGLLIKYNKLVKSETWRTALDSYR